MHRNTLTEISGRAMLQAVRMTLNKANDDPMMQEMDFDGMNSDGRNKVERVQAFGFTSTPLPRDEDDKKGKQDSGKSGETEKPKGPAAEGIAIFLGGQRNHPVVIAVDDRRHRPMGLKPGENAQYDDQGQMTLLRRNGLFMLSLDDEGDGSAPGATMLKDGSGKSEKKERMVSLRHVQKKKQERKKGGQQGGDGGSSSGGGGAGPLAAEGGSSGGGQKKEDYKHEGETVNTEVRATKTKVEFRTGDDVVGSYDKSSKTWNLNAGGSASKSLKVNDDHVHMMHGGNQIWVDSSGCWSSKPIELKTDPSAVATGPSMLERIEQLEARVRELENARGQ